MKKLGVCVVLFLVVVLSIAPLCLAATNNSSNSSSTSSTSDSGKINDGFDCLEDKADDCSALTTQEIALTILATPDDIFDKCVKELENRESSNNWGNIRDTALAVLALKHAGKKTKPNEEWLLDQEEVPTDLVWYMQEDSNEETQCNIGYDGNDYTINIGKNKKIDSDAGTCLDRAQSNFWLEISPSCYEEDFNIECDEDFIANLLYRNRQSTTIYVLAGTDSAPAFGSIELNVDSKCLGSAGSCDYEATAWATLALLKTGHNIEEFIPYLIAMSDTNERYLPAAFIYMLTNYDDYATQLINEQKLGNYWEADGSANNRFYDTSLALVALGSSSSEQVKTAKDWLLFSQGSNGCWQNSIKETASVLWSLTGRTGRLSGTTGSGVTYCSEANYFCIPSNDCPGSQDVGNNYFCASLSETCCMTENLKTCSDHGGKECKTGEVCAGNERKSSDATKCCTGTCQARAQENECEAAFYNCMGKCSDFQEPVSAYACDGGEVCCKTKTGTKEEASSTWWIWVLIILILITAGAILYIYREKLKLLWFQLTTKFGKDKGRGTGGPTGPRPPKPGVPPRPGFPPVRRSRPPVARAPVRRKSDMRDVAMQETFKKLRDMSR